MNRDPAVEAWYADDEDGVSPSEVWWDSHKDAWCGGYEEGMKVPSVAERIVKALPACLTRQALWDISSHLGSEVQDQQALDAFWSLVGGQDNNGGESGD